MSDDGCWVPLPEGQMPAEGQRVRVMLEGEVRSLVVDEFLVGPPGPANIVVRDAEHVVSVEVWEPAEKLIHGEWYRDANGRVARRQAPEQHQPWWGWPQGWMRDDAMVRPLSIARWEPVQ